jgi:hypothetical protein
MFYQLFFVRLGIETQSHKAINRRPPRYVKLLRRQYLTAPDWLAGRSFTGLIGCQTARF